MLQSIAILWIFVSFIAGAIFAGGLIGFIAYRKNKSVYSEYVFFKQAYEQISSQYEQQKHILSQNEQIISRLSTENARIGQKMMDTESRASQFERENQIKESAFASLQKELYEVKSIKDNDIITLRENNNILQDMNTQKERLIQKFEQDILTHKEKFDALQKQYYENKNIAENEIITLSQQNKTLLEHCSKREAELVKLQNDFSQQFENLANRIFEEKSKTFQAQSSQNLEHILNPVKNSFVEFKSKIEENFSKHRDEQMMLKQSIRDIVSINETMSRQTENLTKALKGDNKLQGNWGEMILERLLEETGLVKGRDYTLQGEGLGLINEENNKKQRPDVIVHLPDEKHIIIDSKMSLVDYERYIAADNDQDRAVARLSFLTSVRKHIKDLSSKSYQDNQTKNTPDFVLMFMPIEGAYNFALHQDNDLHEFAWKNRIVLVCTSTLFATLKTVASIWRLEKQNLNAQAIAEQAGKIYDKMHGFLSDIESIGDHIKKTQNHYDNAMNKLSTGKGNLISQTLKLKDMGVHSKKDITKDFSQQISHNVSDTDLIADETVPHTELEQA